MTAHAPAQLAGRAGRTLRAALYLALLVLAGDRGFAADAKSEKPDAGRDLTRLSLEELSNVEVTSLSKRPEKYSQVAGAVAVITQEDIRRAGVTTLAEALRLAPGVSVEAIDSNQWAIGIRGFGSRLSRSMLVMIDGRSVYTPLFAGVYWEVQDTLLEDVERIEIIRGPGGSLWGANAVNGIINVVTKHSRDTQGGSVTVGGGNYEAGFSSFRYGGASPFGTYRVYGKVFDRTAGFHRDGNDFDGWTMGQLGFRLDTVHGRPTEWTLQGDAYDGRVGERTTVTNLTAPPFARVLEDDARLSGGSLLGHWHRTGSRSDIAIRAYYDRTDHTEPTFGEVRDTINLDLQQRLHAAERYQLTWGLGYEVSSGRVSAVPTVSFLPARRTDNLYTGFVHGEASWLHARLRLAGGTKLLHNGYSGFEAQPSVRGSWMLSSHQSVWLSFSRAVRIPSRLEHDLAITSAVSATAPIFVRIEGSKSFTAERLHAYEAGYRAAIGERGFATFDVFYNHYPDLLSTEPRPSFTETDPPPAHLVFPFTFANLLTGESYGGEVAGDWLPRAGWRIGGNYSFVKLDLRRLPGSRDAGSVQSLEGGTPEHQASLRSHWDLPAHLEFDTAVRYVSRLSSQKVNDYVTSDARFGWRAGKRLELSVIGRNLLQPHHAEFGGGTQVKRSAYGKITWHW